VEAFDTNVLVRLCVRDDEAQYGRAEQVFRRATAGTGAWLSTVVLAEVVWVLRVAYKFDRATIAATLRRLIAIDGVHVEDVVTTRLALTPSKAVPRISPTT
jgi:predicted nucleic-acid-binding protein